MDTQPGKIAMSVRNNGLRYFGTHMHISMQSFGLHSFSSFALVESANIATRNVACRHSNEKCAVLAHMEAAHLDINTNQALLGL